MILKRNIFITNFSLTFLSQIIITILNIFILKILSHQIPAEGLGIYLIIRRLIALAYPIITINLSMSLARFISFDQKKAENYFLYSFLCLSFACLPLMLFLPLAKNFLSQLIFGSNEFAVLLFPIMIFLYSNSFQTLCVGFFRGKQNYFLMNLVDVLFWVEATILLSVLLVNPDFIQFLYKYLLIYAIVSFAFNCFLVIKYSDLRDYFKAILKRGAKIKFSVERNFLRYGAFRIPSGFFLGTVFFAPIFVATNYFSLKTAAYIGVIISIIRMVQLIGFPFNTIFLPKFSNYQASNKSDLIRNSSQLIVEFLFTLPLLVGLFCAFFSPEVILIWFGTKYSVVIPYLIFVSPIIGFLIGYVFITGILDGFSNYPYVNIITAISMMLVILLLIFSVVFSWGLLGLTIALGVGLMMLGVSSLYILARTQNLKLLDKKNITAIGWFLTVLLIFFVYNKTIIINQIYISILFKVILSLIILGISFIIYRKLDYKWINELQLRMKARRTK